MDNNEIIKFRQSVEQMSVEELEKQAGEIRNLISKMILDSDLIIKAAIIDSLIKEKKEMDA